MNILKSVLLAGVVALPLSISAQAADIAPDVPSDVETSMYGVYLRADAGWSFLEWGGGSDDNAHVIGGGIGYQFSDNFRADITADFTGDYDIAPGAEISTTTLLGNAYFDWKNDSMFTPYVGAGLGYGWVDGSGTARNREGMAYGLASGVAVDLTNNLSVDLGYRFRGINVKGANPYEHQATVGLRVKF